MIKITVNLGECKIAGDPDSLVTHSLGSCVGIALYDPVAKIGGLAHIMLPKAPAAPNGCGSPATGATCKYADTAVKQLLNEIIKSGADKKRIVAKMAGGACMFSGAGTLSENMKIGQKNLDAAQETIAALGIPIVSRDTGGNIGRTVELRTTDGKLLITSSFSARKEI